ncbi:MAG TPA: TIM barrel protein [Anaerolineales bacterium]|nr:TIM barrel protein [Anaerolineales bacterium]
MSTLSFRFGTVGSPLSTPKKPGGSVGGILRCAELGLLSLELGWVRAVRVTEESCADIRATAQAQGVAISIHAPYFINLNADAEEWPKSRKRLMDAAHYGNLAGATDIIFHPGSYFGGIPEQVLSTAIPRLAHCVEELRAAGNPVTLRPETMGKSAMLGNLEDTLAMSQVVLGVEPCLDFAHLHARAGDGSMNSYDEWARTLETYGKALGESALKTLHIHLSGIAYGVKGEKEHLPLGESDLDLVAILLALHDFGCRGRILCESPILEDDALKCKHAWCEVSQEDCRDI